ncbi:hypothetical protein ACHAWF_011920 [Thalassiosira exigua]
MMLEIVGASTYNLIRISDRQIKMHDTTCRHRRLSRQPSVDCNKDTCTGALLSSFLETHPILFECLYDVFEPVMSNSRLCNQIHVIQRNGLEPQTGMSLADHHREYSSTTDDGMREAQRTSRDGSSESLEERKKAKVHLKTKTQQLLMYEEMVTPCPSNMQECRRGVHER